MTDESASLPTDGFRDRLRRAVKDYEGRTGKDADQAWLGREVAALVGKGAPYSQGAVSKWSRKDSPPDVRIVFALAHLLGVRASWLAFDDGEMRDPQAPARPQHPRGQPAPVGVAKPRPATGAAAKRGGPRRRATG